MKRCLFSIFSLFSTLIFSTTVDAQKLNQVLQEDETSIKAYLDRVKIDPIEGIYKNYNGSYYRLGIKKIGEIYYAIILEAYDKSKWKSGTVKAIFESTAVEAVYGMKWLMGDRSSKETIAQLEDGAILKFKMATGEFGEVVETRFIKLYPK